MWKIIGRMQISVLVGGGRDLQALFLYFQGEEYAEIRYQRLEQQFLISVLILILELQLKIKHVI